MADRVNNVLADYNEIIARIEALTVHGEVDMYKLRGFVVDCRERFVDFTFATNTDKE